MASRRCVGPWGSEQAAGHRRLRGILRELLLAGRLRRNSVDMLSACEHALSMSKMIQIRNVPDEVHKKLKMRALEEGLTLSDLLVREARQLAERPTLVQMRARLQRRERVSLPESAADMVRGARGEP